MLFPILQGNTVPFTAFLLASQPCQMAMGTASLIMSFTNKNMLPTEFILESKVEKTPWKGVEIRKTSH